MFTFVLCYFFACSDKEQQRSCDYNGETYSVGETFPAEDGCNSCTCMEEGDGVSMGCTEMDCSEPEPVSCAELSIEECESNAICTVVYGSPIMLDSENECYAWANEVNAVGCMDADTSCTEELKHGASSDDPNNCYGFGGCMPEGWGDCGLGNYPDCN